MRQQRNDLQPFNMVCLENIFKLRNEMYCGRNNMFFLDELKKIITSNSYFQSNEWERLSNDFVLGEVWSQAIGDFYHKNTVHRFSYLYVKSEGLVIKEHGHQEYVHKGTQIRKIREWYVFPDGKMELCKKDKTHQLVNNYGKSIYVLSIKICSNGRT